ncbi:MAG TPA: hypothetical protein VIO64_18995 [Pseudobacteroides sp.]|uniref:hypothetical protein n=1 Tax=Pseudobacteroides sp. TaxID=1968840 RepID=UPI002F935D0D
MMFMETQLQLIEIRKAFLKHIIDTAESQFKCKFKNLHIFTPINLPEYNIVTKRSIDESTAVLYSTIAESIEKGTITMGQEHTALVLDCGGGTTDISSCKNGISNFYHKLDKCYEDAERIIPTRYKDYENKLFVDYQEVQSNFYFLWEISREHKNKILQ